MQASPQVAVSIVAGVEKAPASTTVFAELVGQFGQQSSNFIAMTLEAFGVKPVVGNDSLYHNVVGGILAVLVETVEKDLFDLLWVEHQGIAHFVSFRRFLVHSVETCVIIQTSIDYVKYISWRCKNLLHTHTTRCSACS